MRDLTGPSQTRAIRDLLQGIFALEALNPSARLWLVSGWVSNIGVIDNRARQFVSIDPNWPSTMIPLSSVFKTILERGGSIAMVLRDDPHNYQFVERVRPLISAFSARFKIHLSPDFHEKGLVGDDFALSGSMNFTHRGLEVNDEHIIYRTDPSIVSERLLTLQTLWGEKLNAQA